MEKDSKPKEQETYVVEEKILFSNTFIECTGCSVKSVFVSTPSKVFVKKQQIATAKDLKYSDNIIPFQGNCSFNGYNPCVYSPKEGWKDMQPKVGSAKSDIITEGSFLECTLGGRITFSELRSTPPPSENVVDQLQNKINKAANYISEKATKVAKDVAEAIVGLGESVKKVGGFALNEDTLGAIKSAGDFVDTVDRKKAELDVGVENVDIRLQNLRAELTQKLTGVEQELKDLKVVTDAEPTEDEEFKFNETVFENANKDAIKELLNYFDTNIDSLNNSAEKVAPSKGFEIKDDVKPTRYFTGSEDTSVAVAGNALQASNNLSAPKPGEKSPDITTYPFPPEKKTPWEIIIEKAKKQGTFKKNLEKQNEAIAGPTYDQVVGWLKEKNPDIDFGNRQENIDALSLLYRVEHLLRTAEGTSSLSNTTTLSPQNLDVSKQDMKLLGGLAASAAISEVTKEIYKKGAELNTKVQAEIDELLKEIGYAEAMQKYQQESKELQKDLDRASAVLDGLENFDSFIDGLTAKALGRFADKYKKSVASVGKNMGLLNTSMSGLSYAAAGFPAGDVVTHVEKKRDKNDDDENEDGDGAGAGTGLGGADDPANDRNKEPKILRLYVVDENRNMIDLSETVPPETQLFLVIQANGKADGKDANIDLKEQTEYCKVIDPKYKNNEGIVFVKSIKGESPNFDIGMSYTYDNNGELIGVDSNGNNLQLQDKTYIRVKMISPENESEEL